MARNDPAALERLTTVMTAWARAATLDHAAFAERFLGRAADDPVAGELRAAAMGAATAKSHADLAETAGHLAAAMQAIGIDRWPSFVADAEVRANDPATRAAVADSRQPRDADAPLARAGVMAYAKPPSLSELMKRDDSIRPVYPVETALGIAATGAAGGVAAAARAVGGAITRRVLPKAGPPSGEVAGDSTARAASAEEPTSPDAEGSETTELTKPSLPADPDDLLKEGWEETSHPDAAATGHRTFENPNTGEAVRFDKGRPGEHAFERKDHYHRMNPNKTGKSDEYLDRNGNPVARGSDPSHIVPRSP